MQYRKLGRYGIKVSEVALGGWLTQGRSISDDTTNAIVKEAFDLGINFFDTADVYNAGEAEKSLAKAIKGFRREDIVIGTKCYFPMSDRPNDRGLSRKHIFESVHNSLKRLEVDYVDIMQFHRYDPDSPTDESVRAMDDLIRQGKILYWGTSEWPAHEIMNAYHLAKEMNCMPPASNQPVYNMLNRGIENAVIPACTELGIGQVVFSPLAQGVLTGKYVPGQPLPAGSRGADDKSNMFMGNLLTDDVLTRVQKLKAFAESLGTTVGKFALAWCLRQPNLSCVIVGASRVEQIKENVEASELKFDAAVWQQAEKILEG
ncbi:MAG: aldo/keto reductase family protein [Fimbriimonadaceae bacterium]|nr:aldo/keto reductase family protein [Fimbriimonadaceae bacterium]